MQSQGIQFYLGTYDTEEEAAKAYDRKAREEKGGRSQTNFDDNGYEIGLSHMLAMYPQFHTPPVHTMGDSITDTTGGVANSEYTDIGSSSSNSEPSYRHNFLTATPVRFLWDRLCVISERLLLATAAMEKLKQLQEQGPDEQKQSMIAALSNEITLLTVVKSQIESSVARCFSSELFGSTPPPALPPILPSISQIKRPLQMTINGLTDSSCSGSSCNGHVNIASSGTNRGDNSGSSSSGSGSVNSNDNGRFGLVGGNTVINATKSSNHSS